MGDEEEEEETTDAIRTGHIVIERFMNSEGPDDIQVSCSDVGGEELHIAEILGLLEWAKQVIFESLYEDDDD